MEKRLPDDAPDGKPYGLMTFTINQILTRAEEPLTYLELANESRASTAAGAGTPRPPCSKARIRTARSSV